MSHLQYFNYPGYGERRKDVYSQSVRHGDIVEASGQGGWYGDSDAFPRDFGEEMDQAFANVETTLHNAGVTDGWAKVYKMRVYLVPYNQEAVEHLVRNINKYCPNHKPLITAVGVLRLHEGMRVEVEVSAHLGGK